MTASGNVVPGDRARLLRALEDSPDDPVLLLRLGHAELSAGQAKAAEDCFRRAAKTDPTADAMEGLGATLTRQGRFREALPYLRQAISLRPGNFMAWNCVGEALGSLGRAEEAADAFSRAVSVRGDFAPAHYNLGLALRRLGRREDAIGALRRAVELQPDFAEALHALGRTLHGSGRYQAAIDLPPGTILNPTLIYARFRLTPQQDGACLVDIAPTGYAYGGEVEDYFWPSNPEPTAVGWSSTAAVGLLQSPLLPALLLVSIMISIMMMVGLTVLKGREGRKLRQ